MKKIIASAGLLALGATGVQAASHPDYGDMDKSWSVSATLRGFYDDNYALANSGPAKRHSYGFEVSPSALLHHSTQQTDVGASYTYDLRYFDDRSTHKIDNTHQFDAWLNHNFSERYSLDANESFVIAQEPDLIDPTLSTIQRANQDAVRNDGKINFHAQLTRLLGLRLGYQNLYYDYKNNFINNGGIIPSQSGLLDRVEHLATVELSCWAMPETIGSLGYTFSAADYTGNEPIDAFGNFSNAKNNYSHKVYVGVQHTFTPNLNGAIHVGGRYTDHYNTVDHKKSFGPYVNLVGQYTYLPGSYFQLDFTHDLTPTDQISTTPVGAITTDQDSSAVSATLHHQITPKLSGHLTGTYQHSTANGGLLDGQNDDIFYSGVNLSYQINHYFSADAGYNYDRVTSDVSGRGYKRNRVYIGVTARY